MDIRVLGPLDVVHDGHAVPIRSGRPRRLLVALVLRLGERVSNDALIELLWPEDAPRNSANALQILVSYLRKALPGLRDGRAGIETVEKGYRLVADRSSVDAYRMEHAATRAGDEADLRARLRLIDEGLAEWRGAPAPELEGDPYAEADVARLHEVRLTLLEQRAEVLVELGHQGEAVAGLRQMVAEHPLREKPQVLLMTALYRGGRQAEALEVYEKARRTLAEELGLDPGPALRATAEAVLRQSPQLDAAEAGPGADVSGPARSFGSEAWRPLDQLIGREEECRRLHDLLLQRRLMTLTGPGGAGKTRLAAHLASQGSEESVWWADLAPASVPAAVLASIAHAIGVPATPAHDVEAIAGHLGRGDGLLVLDTCERVRATVKPVVEALLRACPGLRILATSRQPLGAATELAWPVPPLSLPHPEATSVTEVGQSAAVQLFLERATSRCPDLVLSPGNAGDIARICLLLDGLPLALELAAAHSASLLPAEMVKVLDDRLRILVDTDRDARQGTLRATIQWSHDQLERDEATLFERLSVFAGPFSLEGALAVAGDDLDRDGLELLLALVRQSLVARSGHRYRMLDTIRAFAWGNLSAGEREAAQRRHAEWHVRLVDEAAPSADGEVAAGWRGELRGVLPDLRAALTWCFSTGEADVGARLLASLWWLWPREGVFDEAAEWFRMARRAVNDAPELEARLLSSAATHAVTRGELGSAEADGSLASERLAERGDTRGAARALLPVGIARWARGDYQAAAVAHDRARELFEQAGDAWGSALAQVLRARTALDAEDGETLDRLATAEAAARRTGDGHVLAAALVQRARAALAQGRYAEAEALARESLALNDLHGHREGAVGSLHTLGFAAVGRGDVAAADTAFRQTLRWGLAMHHRAATAESLDGLALVAARAERWGDAGRLLARAEAIRSEVGIQRSTATAGLLGAAGAQLYGVMGEAELGRLEEEAAGLDLHQLSDG